MSFRYGGLFSGIGALEIACEQHGGEPVFMCEQDDFCQRILRRRFPGVPLFDDVRDLSLEAGIANIEPHLAQPGWLDVLVGGFPCQDISAAGKGAGIKGERSGLWIEFHRVIDELRPKVVLIENVALLRSRGLDVVLHDLQSIGYHAEWDIISAAAVGAPHLRERIWIVARPAEYAVEPVFGEPATDRKGNVKAFGFIGKKLPRSGRMGEACEELVSLAPRKTTRKDGWTFWTGVNLLGSAKTLWKTPHGMCSVDRRRAGPSGNELGFMVNQVERGAVLLPTPQAADGEGGRIEPNLSAARPSGQKRSISLLSAVRHGLGEDGDMPMLPTPKATDGDRGGRGDLLQVVRGNTSPSGHYGNGRLPISPQASDSDHGRRGAGSVERGGGRSLREVADELPEELRALLPVEDGEVGLWPTPDAAVSQLYEGVETWEARRETMKAKGYNGNGAGIPLAMAVLMDSEGRRIWPTPKSSVSGPDYARMHRERSGSDDLATAVAREPGEHLIWPTPVVTDSINARNEFCARPNGNGRHHGGRTLTDALILTGDIQLEGDENGNRVVTDRPLVPTPTAQDGSNDGGPAQHDRNSLPLNTLVKLWGTPMSHERTHDPRQVDHGEQLANQAGGSLNPTWVEWLMGLPLWWTDPTIATDFCTQLDWDAEPLHVATRVDRDIPLRPQRLKAIGNSVVWPCAYYALGRALAVTSLDDEEDSWVDQLAATVA